MSVSTFPFMMALGLAFAAPAAAAPTAADPAAADPAAADPTAADPTTEASPTWRDVPESKDPFREPLGAHPGGLTPDYVAEKAVSAAPSLVAKDADLRIAAARVDQTMAAYLPQVQLSAGYTRLSDVNVQFGAGALVGAANSGLLGVGACPDGSGANCIVDSGGLPVGAASFNIPQVLDQFSTQAMLSIPISDYVFSMTQGIRAARSTREAAQLTKDAETLKVRVDARIAYYNWVRTVAQVAASRDALDTAQARLEEAQVAYRVGVLMKADLLRLEALVADVERTIVEAEAFEELAREQLSMIMDEPVREYRVGEEIVGQVIEVGDWPEMHVLVDDAMRDRLELRSLGLNDRALASGIKAKRAGLYPRLSAFAEGTYANPNQRFFPATKEWNGTWSAGAKLTWNLTGIWATHHQVKELQAQRRGLDANEEMLRRGIRMEVTSAYIDRRRAIASIRLSQKTREASEAAYAAVAAQFRVGKATATDVIGAQGQRLSAQLQAINARIDLRVAETKLTYATGRPT